MAAWRRSDEVVVARVRRLVSLPSRLPVVVRKPDMICAPHPVLGTVHH